MTKILNEPLKLSVSSFYVGFKEIAELLIRKGADINVVGQDGFTALTLAAFRGNFKS